MEISKATGILTQKLDWFSKGGTKGTEKAPAEATDETIKTNPNDGAEAKKEEHVPAEEGETASKPKIADIIANDELLWSTQYTYDEFIDSLTVDYEDRGATVEEKRHWAYPRRWSVRLHNLKIVNCMADSLTCFCEFDFGGSRSECRVQMGTNVCILNRGESKNYIRTPVVQNVVKDMPRSFNCKNSFEYRGSYLDLEYEKLKVKLWKCRKYTINCLESIYEETLITFARGNMHVELPMYKTIEGEKKLRCRISFDLYFQELYDFELSFLNWRVTGLKSSVNLFNQSYVALSNVEDKMQNSKTSVSGLTSNLFDRFRYFVFKMKLDKQWRRKERNKMREVIEKKPEAEEDKDDEVPVETDEYSKLLERRGKMVEDVTDPAPLEGKRDMPSPRIEIKLKTPGHRGLKVVSSVMHNSNSPYWPNLGEIVFRGTLIDLEHSQLEISLLDTSAPKAANCVGYTRISLQGVVDYPFVKARLLTPRWLTLKANVEGWSNALNGWSFGALNGRVEINRTPRYRQNVTHEMNVPTGTNYPLLFVNVTGIDQIITFNERTNIDSYVEVTFNGICYCTSVCADNLGPVWNEEMVFPIFVDDSKDFGYETLMGHDIRFNVWGRYTNDPEGKILYLGGTQLHPHEIFFTSKNNLRAKAKKTHSEGYDNTFGGGTVYETRVYTGSKQLKFLQDDERCSNLTISVWVYPDIPSDKFPTNVDFNVLEFDTTSLLPSSYANAYTTLQDDWERVIRMKISVNGLKSMAINECTTQYDQKVYMPCLISRMHPPVGIDTPNAIFHMIRCIPFVPKSFDRVYTPNFLMKLKEGHAFDHAILQCCYLRGLIPPVEAYVCLGTLNDKRPHAWVVTIKDEIVKYWESTNGEVYALKGKRIKIPYNTLEVVFNERNVWLNVHDFHPLSVQFDTVNPMLWYPFAPKDLPVRLCYVPNINYSKIDRYELEKMNSKLQQDIERMITIHRSAQNLQTRWNKSEGLHVFLRKGLRFLHQINTCPDDLMKLAKCELQEWKSLLNEKIPQSYQLIGRPMHFNSINPDIISEHIKQNVPFVDSRENHVTYAISTELTSLPGNLLSTYVFILYAVKIHERVRRMLLLEQEKMVFMKNKKMSVAKETDSTDVSDEELVSPDPSEGLLKCLTSGSIGKDTRGEINLSFSPEVISRKYTGQKSEEDDEEDPFEKISRNLSIQSKQFTKMYSSNMFSEAGSFNNLQSLDIDEVVDKGKSKSKVVLAKRVKDAKKSSSILKTLLTSKSFGTRSSAILSTGTLTEITGSSKSGVSAVSSELTSGSISSIPTSSLPKSSTLASSIPLSTLGSAEASSSSWSSDGISVRVSSVEDIRTSHQTTQQLESIKENERLPSNGMQELFSNNFSYREEEGGLDSLSDMQFSPESTSNISSLYRHSSPPSSWDSQTSNIRSTSNTIHDISEDRTISQSEVRESPGSGSISSSMPTDGPPTSASRRPSTDRRISSTITISGTPISDTVSGDATSYREVKEEVSQDESKFSWRDNVNKEVSEIVSSISSYFPDGMFQSGSSRSVTQSSVVQLTGRLKSIEEVTYTEDLPTSRPIDSEMDVCERPRYESVVSERMESILANIPGERGRFVSIGTDARSKNSSSLDSIGSVSSKFSSLIDESEELLHTARLASIEGSLNCTENLATGRYVSDISEDRTISQSEVRESSGNGSISSSLPTDGPPTPASWRSSTQESSFTSFSSSISIRSSRLSSEVSNKSSVNPSPRLESIFDVRKLSISQSRGLSSVTFSQSNLESIRESSPSSEGTESLEIRPSKTLAEYLVKKTSIDMPPNQNQCKYKEGKSNRDYKKVDIYRGFT